ERMEERDIIAYLKLALNPNDSIALQRVINSPPRGIGRQTLEELARRASAGSADILSADIRTGSGSDRVSARSSERDSSPTPGSPDGQPGWGGTVREGVGADTLSLWETITLVIDDPQNLSNRAVSALKSFRK